MEEFDAAIEPAVAVGRAAPELGWLPGGYRDGGTVASSKTYARNAVIGCLGGEIGGVVRKFLPGWVKNKAITMTIAFIIKYVR